MKHKRTKRIEVVRSIVGVRRAVGRARARGKTIGLVPTMGALHAGHQSLIRRSAARTEFTVVSIFVNPTQFGPREDLSRYPRPLRRDLALAGEAGADLAFVPAVKTIYPDGFSTNVTVEELTTTLCGASRPTHFRGVTTVVSKLLNIVQPDVAFFGRKDAQQAFVIQRMVRDLDIPVQISVCPTVRERDGLAMSSRNAYLSKEERAQAPALHRALVAARGEIRRGKRSAARLKNLIRRIIGGKGSVRIDYVEIVDADRLQPVRFVKGKCLLAAAVFFGRARLIDNELVRIK